MSAGGQPSAPARSRRLGPPRRLRPFTHRTFVFVAIGCVVYSTWLAEEWINPTLPAWRSFVSELAAIDQPNSLIPRVGDALAAICAAIAARFGWRSRAFTRQACVLLWAFALFTLLDAIFPMACAPSLSPVCAAGDEAGTLGLSHNVHTVTSSLANAATLGLAGWWLVRHRGRQGARQLAATLGAAAHILTAAVTGGLALAHSDLAGIFQRVSLLALMVWALTAASLRFDKLRRQTPCTHR